MAATWQAYAERVCRTVSPGDFEGRPFYAIDGDRLPCQHRPVAGYTGVFLSAVLKPHLMAAGAWRGCGFACVAFPSRAVPAYDAEACIAIVLHEAAHWLSNGIAAALATAEHHEQLPDLLEALAEYAAPDTPSELPDTAPAVEPWQSHELPFIRAGVHLLWRSLDCGFVHVRPDLACIAGPLYGLSHWSSYLVAFEGELVTRRGESISAIAASELPPEALELFAADKARHLARRQHGHEASA